jgi:uncharacterized protein YqeY
VITIETLQKDMMSALKSGDTLRKAALSSAVSEVKKVAIDKNCRDNITEDLIISVLRKEIKVLNEQIETCTASRPELKQEFEIKKAVLNEYVPQLITDKSVIREMVLQACRDEDCDIALVKSNKGLVMKTIAPQFKGKVDMKTAQEVIDTILQ